MKRVLTILNRLALACFVGAMVLQGLWLAFGLFLAMEAAFFLANRWALQHVALTDRALGLQQDVTSNLTRAATLNRAVGIAVELDGMGVSALRSRSWREALFLVGSRHTID